MAGEQVIIASAVHTAVAAGVFLYMYHSASGRFWKHVWMIGIFLTLLYGFTIDQWAFQHILVANELNDLALSIVIVLQYMVIIGFGYVILSLAYYAIRKLVEVVGGGNMRYGKADEID